MAEQELVPRNYQAELIRICVQKNTIIYLPTGTGKTFIAFCALKELSKDDYDKPYSEGGKISVMIVNTVALVNQHVKTFEENSTFTISGYTGDMNVDFWSKEKWATEFDRNNVIILTAQILQNCLQANFIDLNNVNLIIFDECHHGVENHPMREIMKHFQALKQPPRVIGLTATLLNGNVKPEKVRTEVLKLETTFHAKVATVDALASVIGYSTKPQEIIINYQVPQANAVIAQACEELRRMETIVRSFKVKPWKSASRQSNNNMRHLKEEKPYEKFYKLLMDAQIHFEMLDVAGARIACIIYTIHMELQKRTICDARSLHVVNAIISMFAEIRQSIDDVYHQCPVTHRLLTLSSNKIQKLIQILKSFNKNSTQDLCGIIFVERKNTAIFLYHLLKELKSNYDDLEFLKPDFIIGVNANPMACNTESLYYSKLNKKIINKFNSKEVNLLIASNVIEEGIDVQMCTLVVKFDPIKDYRAYVQSKGRARHSSSLFYIMIESQNEHQFVSSYHTFRTIEQYLNDYLLGTYDERPSPNKHCIDTMYNETQCFHVDGIGSASINEVGAPQLLMMYCSSVTADAYTIYEPIMYLQVHDVTAKFRVHIELPIFCPIQDLISGEWRDTKRSAKRSACFQACVQLYNAGELNKNLIPKSRKVEPEVIEYLFRHWPERREKTDGASKVKKSYEKVLPTWMATPIVAGNDAFLHIIQLTPLFQTQQTALFNMYTDDLCYGLLTAQRMPNICDFPIYITLGTLQVSLQVNKSRIVLSDQQLTDIKRFHHLVFSDILNIVPSYLIMGDNKTQYSYLVPVRKSTETIDFTTISKHPDIVDFYQEPTTDDKLNMVVDDTTHLLKIVTPYYRSEKVHHLVLEVSSFLTAASDFPNADHSSYGEYFQVKYDRAIVNMNAPLLTVQPLSRSLNYLRPRGAAAKRKREETYESTIQHFVPELCIKQEFPPSLWVCSTLIPSILHRIEQLLKAYQLQSDINSEAFPGVCEPSYWQPLAIDDRLVRFQMVDNRRDEQDQSVAYDLPTEITPEQITKMINSNQFNKEYFTLMDDMKYPWTSENEPQVDCFRNLAVTQLDIELLSKFLSRTFQQSDKSGKKERNSQPGSSGLLAINYERKYRYEPIKLLQQSATTTGPELRTIYESLCAAKSHDIVNLERLETLGDSVLKFIASFYIFVKFPKFSEGEATEVKGRIISNRNLFYLANLKRLGGYLKVSDLNPIDEWLPPGYCTPSEAQSMIENQNMHIGKLFDVWTSKEEQLAGKLNAHNLALLSDLCQDDDDVAPVDSSMCHYINVQQMGDKTVADAVEAILGAYVESMSLQGGLAAIQWFGILPKDEQGSIFDMPIADPIINASLSNHLAALLPSHEILAVEKILGYKFRNPAYLLQALTHTSFSTNRLTLSYQRLEFIGDAVLDMLITMHIYEHNETLSPGDLTDLRSALVNNETFAAYIVKYGLHKYLKHYNDKLRNAMNKFENYQAARNHEITSDVLVLLNEEHLRIAENVDVPKILGDLFESLAGAIFLDSGKDFEQVWRVIHKMMWKEIAAFSQDIPKNPIRMLHEMLAPLKPKFSEPYEVDYATVMMKVDFILNGSLIRVHGFGTSKTNAKKAAAKIALRLLSTKKQQ